MPKLLDLLKFADKPAPDKRRFFTAEPRLRRDERDAAILAGKYPPDDIESISEYRLASLLQYPHY